MRDLFVFLFGFCRFYCRHEMVGIEDNDRYVEKDGDLFIFWVGGGEREREIIRIKV